MSVLCQHNDRDCYGKTELPLLFEITRMMNESLDIKDALAPVMKTTADYLSSVKVLLAIHNRESSKIVLEAASGTALSSNISYQLGEGITGEVAKTGRPIFVPKIIEDNRFLNKTNSQLTTTDRRDLSFLCVPIHAGKEVAGTISICRIYSKAYNYQEDIRLLTIIGSLINQAVVSRQAKAEELERLRRENASLHERLQEKAKLAVPIIGNSNQMQQVFRLVNMVAPTNANVLIRGESGTGKEMLVEAIHMGSGRKKGPLIKVNCSALPENLIESELFGHEKGSFTGAMAQRAGRFEMAHGGTIFLDEFGDLPMPTQVKLLRVLQEKEFERVGGSQTIKSDVRIVAATNRDLESLVKEEKFREDLYYRINVFPIYVPPLRERITDIPLLVDHFIAKCNKNNGTDIKRISQSAIDMLMIYKWPGNVRELENCIEWASITSSDGAIRANNLPPTLQTAGSTGTELSGTFNTIISNLEKQLIIDALTKTKGNLIQAASMLDITERMIGTRVKKFDIDPKRFKV
jgi:Nif-specific regulatory protein